MTDIKKQKEEFLKIYNENIKREGAAQLLDFIKSSDFFEAPASTKFHSAFDGGLCFHSVNVYHRFKELVLNEYGKDYAKVIDDESIAVIALLHDICKVNFYKKEMRNVKVENEWVKQPYYTVEDSLPFGHGEKSVYMISAYIKLSRAEAMAINWHMGGFDQRVVGGSYAMSEAFYKFPTAALFHIADVMATYLDETVK